MTMSEPSPNPLESSNEEALATPNAGSEERMQQLARRQKRMLYVSMSATLLLGLTTTASYIRGRMVEATPTAPSVTRPRIATTAKAVNPAPPAVAVAAKRSPLAGPEPPSAAALPMQPKAAVVTTATLKLIDPRAGELYLQLAALDLQRSQNYVGYLDQAQLHARIAPGPSKDLYRVVLGPFPNELEMLRTKARLDQDHIECIIRLY